MKKNVSSPHPVNQKRIMLWSQSTYWSVYCSPPNFPLSKKSTFVSLTSYCCRPCNAGQHPVCNPSSQVKEKYWVSRDTCFNYYHQESQEISNSINWLCFQMNEFIAFDLEGLKQPQWIECNSGKAVFKSLEGFRFSKYSKQYKLKNSWAQDSKNTKQKIPVRLPLGFTRVCC